MQARERLARAFARLETLIGGMPERIRLLESSRNEATLRIQEIEELLDRERHITEQRQSLSDSSTEEARHLTAKLEKAEEHISSRDKKIAEIEGQLVHRNGELLSYEKTHVDSLDREDRLVSTIAKLEEENAAIERQLELLKEERNTLQGQLAETEAKENSYALAFTQDERLNLLKTVDGLIERVDTIVGSQAESLK